MEVYKVQVKTLKIQMKIHTKQINRDKNGKKIIIHMDK